MNDTYRQVIIYRKAEKIIKRLDGDTLESIRRAIRSLVNEPRSDSVKKPAGYDNLYRICVGDWRIIYAIEADWPIVLVPEISPHSGFYLDI